MMCTCAPRPCFTPCSVLCAPVMCTCVPRPESDEAAAGCQATGIRGGIVSTCVLEVVVPAGEHRTEVSLWRAGHTNGIGIDALARPRRDPVARQIGQVVTGPALSAAGGAGAAHARKGSSGGRRRRSREMLAGGGGGRAGRQRRLCGLAQTR